MPRPSSYAASSPSGGHYQSSHCLLSLSDRGDKLGLIDFVSALYNCIRRGSPAFSHSSPERDKPRNAAARNGGGERKREESSEEKEERLTEDSIELITDLIELFEQIDINGDETLAWEEFTQFVVEAGQAADQKEGRALDLLYAESECFLDVSSKRPSRVRYIPQLRKLFSLSEESPEMQIFDPHNTVRLDFAGRETGEKREGGQGKVGMQLVREFSPPDSYQEAAKAVTDTLLRRSPILAFEYLDGPELLALSAGDVSLTFYEVKELLNSSISALKTMIVPVGSAQRVLRWCRPASLLLSSGSELLITGWKIKVADKKVDATPLFRCSQHTDLVQDLLCIPEFDLFVSCSLDRQINVWSLSSGALQGRRVGHKQGVRCLAYAGGGVFLSAGFEFEIFAWDLSGVTEESLFSLRGHHAPVVALQTMQNTRQALSLDAEGTFKWWNLKITTKDVDTDRCIQTFAARRDGLSKWTPNSFTVISSGGGSIAAAGYKLRLFELVSGKPPDHFSCTALYNSVSQTFLTTTDRDIKIWDARTGILRNIFRSISDTEITCVAFDARRRKFVLANQGGEVRVHNLLNGVLMHSYESHDSEVSAIAYGEEEKCVISTSWDRSIRVYDECNSHDLLRCVYNAHSQDITTMVYSSSLSLVATGSIEGVVRVWDFCFLSLEGSLLMKSPAEITALLFFSPFPLLLGCDVDGKVAVWTVRPWSAASPARYTEVASFQNYGHRSAAYYGGERYEDQEEGDDDSKQEEEGDVFSPVPVTSVALVPLEQVKDRKGVAETVTALLALGDDSGSISLWHLQGLIDRLRIKPCPPRTSGKLNYRRKIKRDQAEAERQEGAGGLGAVATTAARGGERSPQSSPDIKSAQARLSLALEKQQALALSRSLSGSKSQSSLPFSSSLTPDYHFVRCWRAHQGEIASLQWLEQQEMLLSCSEDKEVKLWTLGGQLVGILTRNEAPASNYVRYAWDFPANLEKDNEKKEERAVEIFKHVTAERNGRKREQEDRKNLAEEMHRLSVAKRRELLEKEMRLAGYDGGLASLQQDSLLFAFPSSSPQTSARGSVAAGSKRASRLSVLLSLSSAGDGSVSVAVPSSSASAEQAARRPIAGEAGASPASSSLQNRPTEERGNAGGGKSMLENRKRLLEQLRGKQTWIRTPQEIAREAALEKEQKKREKLQKRRGSGFLPPSALESAAHVQDFSPDVSLPSNEEKERGVGDISAPSPSPSSSSSPRKDDHGRASSLINSDEGEGASIAEKANWGVGSLDRQRRMYSHLYTEMERNSAKKEGKEGRDKLSLCSLSDQVEIERKLSQLPAIQHTEMLSKKFVAGRERGSLLLFSSPPSPPIGEERKVEETRRTSLARAGVSLIRESIGEPPSSATSPSKY